MKPSNGRSSSFSSSNGGSSSNNGGNSSINGGIGSSSSNGSNGLANISHTRYCRVLVFTCCWAVAVLLQQYRILEHVSTPAQYDYGGSGASGLWFSDVASDDEASGEEDVEDGVIVDDEVRRDAPILHNYSKRTSTYSSIPMPSQFRRPSATPSNLSNVTAAAFLFGNSSGSHQHYNPTDNVANRSSKRQPRHGTVGNASAEDARSFVKKLSSSSSRLGSMTRFGAGKKFNPPKPGDVGDKKKVNRPNPPSHNDTTYRILCTTEKKKLWYGSYKIRCLDWAAWAERCTPPGSVEITTGVAVRDLAAAVTNPGEKKKKGKTATASSGGKKAATVKSSSSKASRPKFHAIISVKTVPSPSALVDSLLLPDPHSGKGEAGNNETTAVGQKKQKTKRVYVDLVDNYDLKQDQIPTEYSLIFQIEKQKEVFPKHEKQRSYGVVEHWYNSYPQDMTVHPDGDGVPPPGYDIPDVVDLLTTTHHRPLKMATIWNTLRSADEGGCPKLSNEHRGGHNDTLATTNMTTATAMVANVSAIPTTVTYDCIEQEFDIVDWYLQADTSSNASNEMDAILADPSLGRGRLYYNLFAKYDVLVALAKNYTPKLRYGNVQRIVSQMRSGVPVLVEVRGHVLEDFMDRYNYTCAFQRYNDDDDNNQSRHNASSSSTSSSHPYWTFDEAVRQLKKVEIRKECQRQGLEIAKDYSPSKIAQKFLRTVGYMGEFVC